MLKKIVKNIAPEALLLRYHKWKALLATLLFGHPSRNLVIIGITGTKGKSTTANFLWSILHADGKRAGLIGTANIRIANDEQLNHYHMTMPSPFIIQKLLRKMVSKKCEYAILEVTSEGIKQSRHLGIDFDVAVFTNLSPEHLPSHKNSYTQYRSEKEKLFKKLMVSPSKTFHGEKIPKISVVNVGNPEGIHFEKFYAPKKITFALGAPAELSAQIVSITPEKTSFRIGERIFESSLLGDKNAENALCAIAIARGLGISWESIQKGVSDIKDIPGRMERIESSPLSVFVDYAHEEKSMGFIMETAQRIRQKGEKIIVLLGAEGGGRDPLKREKMGKIVGAMADFVVISNVDPYEDDPKKIAEDIAVSAENAGKIRGKDLFIVLDRREGIRKALSLAEKGDIVFITGKGAEQSITIDGIASEWDDRKVVREELKKHHFSRSILAKEALQKQK